MTVRAAYYRQGALAGLHRLGLAGCGNNGECRGAEPLAGSLRVSLRYKISSPFWTGRD